MLECFPTIYLLGTLRGNSIYFFFRGKYSEKGSSSEDNRDVFFSVYLTTVSLNDDHRLSMHRFFLAGTACSLNTSAPPPISQFLQGQRTSHFAAAGQCIELIMADSGAAAAGPAADMDTEEAPSDAIVASGDKQKKRFEVKKVRSIAYI